MGSLNISDETTLRSTTLPVAVVCFYRDSRTPHLGPAASRSGSAEIAVSHTSAGRPERASIVRCLSQPFSRCR